MDKAQAQTNTRPFDPIPIYHEGVFDRKYWYTLQTKLYLKEKASRLAVQIDSIFVEHTIAR